MACSHSAERGPRTGDGVWPTAKSALARPTRKQGKVSARSKGGGGRPDFGIGCRRAGSGTTARATRHHGELDWGISGRSGSLERALGGGGDSAEELIDARWEVRRVAWVVGLVGTGASWWSSRTQRRHRTRTRGNPRSSSVAAKPDGARGFTWDCCNQRKGRSEQWPEHSVTWTTSHQCGQGDVVVETVGRARTGPVGPLKARDVIAFGRHVASMCPAPSDRRARRRPQCHWQVGRRIKIFPTCK
jgi:hypothetical protein